jgi:hypothetical protein
VSDNRRFVVCNCPGDKEKYLVIRDGVLGSARFTEAGGRLADKHNTII